MDAPNLWLEDGRPCSSRFGAHVTEPASVKRAIDCFMVELDQLACLQNYWTRASSSDCAHVACAVCCQLEEEAADEEMVQKFLAEKRFKGRSIGTSFGFHGVPNRLNSALEETDTRIFKQASEANQTFHPTMVLSARSLHAHLKSASDVVEKCGARAGTELGLERVSWDGAQLASWRCELEEGFTPWSCTQKQMTHEFSPATHKMLRVSPITQQHGTSELASCLSLESKMSYMNFCFQCHEGHYFE
eukprot:6462797-Amphidinium_carterae.1